MKQPIHHTKKRVADGKGKMSAQRSRAQSMEMGMA